MTEPAPRLSVAWLKFAVRGLADGTVHPAEIIAAIEADGRRLWRWPEFKQLRESKLASVCAECESSVDLVIQHLIQPRYPGQIRIAVEREVMRRLGVDVRGEYARGETETFTVPAFKYAGCPMCGTRTFYERRTKAPRYRCGNGHTFAEPAVIAVEEHLAQIPFKTFAIERASAVLREHRAEIELRVALSAAQQLIAYFAGHGVITACKRCAYRHDAARMEKSARS